MIALVLVALAAIDPPKPAPAPATVEDQPLMQLLSIRRVYVDRLTGGETAAHMRDLLISALQGSKLFLLTENQERADAILRGAAEDLVFTDTFTTSEGVDARVNAGTGSSKTGQGTTRAGSYATAGVGDRESTRIAERKHEAMAAVRLVNKDGDVIWSTTQESLGAKFRGASADVADKVTRQLVQDYQRARRAKGTGGGDASPPPAR